MKHVVFATGLVAGLACPSFAQPPRPAEDPIRSVDHHIKHRTNVPNFEGQEFDLFVVDTIWVGEFARAGWIADLSQAFPPDVLRRDFLPGAVEAVVVDGKTYAVPYSIDNRIVYMHQDLYQRAGLDVNKPPKTWDELEDVIAKTYKQSAPGQLSVLGFDPFFGSGGKQAAEPW